MNLTSTFSYLNVDILNIYDFFFKFIKISSTDLLSKTRAPLLANIGFIINTTKIDQKFGAPAAGRFHIFFLYG